MTWRNRSALPARDSMNLPVAVRFVRARTKPHQWVAPMAHLFRRETAAVGCLLLSVAFWCAAAPVRGRDAFWSNNRGDGSGTFSNETNWIPDLPFSSDVP